MQKIYSRIDWENEPSTNTPLSESNLNKMDYALDQIDNRVVQLAGYQDRVSQSEKNAKTSEENAKVSEINAKQSELKSKEYMESAFKGTPEGYQEVVEKVDSMEIKTTKENTIKGTKNGGFRLTKVVANTIQNGTPSPSAPIPMLSTGDCVEIQNGLWGYSNGNYTTSANHISNKNLIPCKSGDIVELLVDTSVVESGGVLCYIDGNFYTTVYITETEFNATITTGVNGFKFNLGSSNGLTTEKVGKLQLKINGKYLGCAKTLRSVEMVQGGYSWSTGLFNGGDTFICSKNPISCISGDTIVVETENVMSTLGVIWYNENNERMSTNVEYGASKITAIVPSGVSKFNINVGNVDGISLETAGKVTFTINGVGETVAYYLTQYPMIKGSTLFRENGLVKAMHCAKEKEINGNVALFGIAEKETGNVHFAIPEFAVDAIPCDQNNEYTFSDYLSTWAIDTNGGLWTEIPKTVLASVDANSILAWFSEHLPKVQYPLATPIIETLDTQSQIALNGLETFDGATHVVFDTRVQPLSIKGEVGTSQVGAYTLKSLNNSESNAVRLNELAVALVSL